MCVIAHHELAKKAGDFVKTTTGTFLEIVWKNTHQVSALKRNQVKSWADTIPAYVNREAKSLLATR